MQKCILLISENASDAALVLLQILASCADRLKNFAGVLARLPHRLLAPLYASSRPSLEQSCLSVCAVIYLVDISECPDFNTMYELYDPCTCMFFFRNKVRCPVLNVSIRRQALCVQGSAKRCVGTCSIS